MPNAALQSAANHWAAVEGVKLGIAVAGARLGLPPGVTIVAGYSTMPDLGDSYADALPRNSTGTQGGKERYCRVRVFPPFTPTDPAYRGLAIAHEVFHCFQFVLEADPWKNLPQWIDEGSADWAALTVDPVAFSVGGNNLRNYVNTPGAPLFVRAYSSVGFWGHVQDSVHGLWHKFRKILNAPDNAAAFVAAGANVPAFLSTWGSSPFRDQAGGPPWEMTTPIATPTSDIATPIIVSNPAVQLEKVDAPEYTTAQYLVKSNDLLKPLLHVMINGYARLSTSYNYVNLKDAWFCTNLSDGCHCPPGTTGQLPATRPLTPQADLGLTGDPGKGSKGALVSVALSDFCHRMSPQPGTAPHPGPTRPVGTTAEPHLLDFRFDLFDFQQAGEFTLLRSTSHDLEVQVRQQPYPNSTTVAVNTAVAVRAGGATVEVDLANGGGIIALVDHRRVAAGTHPSGRGSFKVTATGAVLTAPDGSEVDVSSVHYGLSATVKLARRRRRHVEGLLGNWGVPASQQFVGSDGRHYARTQIVESAAADIAVRYGQFGKSWRITQSESLFTYPPGKNTHSYDVPGFPSRNLSAQDLPAAERAFGKTHCRGVGGKDRQMFEGCVLDVGATGQVSFATQDESFARATGITRRRAPTPAAPAKPTPVPGTPTASPQHPIDLGPGTTRPTITYDAASGDTYVAWVPSSSATVDVCMIASAASACSHGSGPYLLRDPLAGTGGAFASPQIVVMPGGTVVVVAMVAYASASVESAGYTLAAGAVAWSSPAGGAAFGSADQGIAAGGHLLAPIGGHVPSGGAIAIDATQIGVYGNSAPNGFTDFTLASPAPPQTPQVDHTNDYGVQPGTDSGQLASLPDPGMPGQYIVVAVGGDSSKPPGCPGGASSGSGYGLGVGTPAQLATQSAWSSSYFATLDCGAATPVLAGGGPTGGTIGVLEDAGTSLGGTGTDGVYYRRFNASTRTFGPRILVSDETKINPFGASEVSVSQDRSGDVYATWVDRRGTVLDYSPSGGATWTPPKVFALSGSDYVVAGVGSGRALIAYHTNEEYLVAVSGR